MKKYIEVCVGVGLNQLFPEYIRIPYVEIEDSEFACPVCTTQKDNEEEN